MRGEVTVRRASALQGGPELQAHPHPCSVVSPAAALLPLQLGRGAVSPPPCVDSLGDPCARSVLCPHPCTAFPSGTGLGSWDARFTSRPSPCGPAAASALRTGLACSAHGAESP